MSIRLLHIYDPEQDPRRLREVQRIFRSYYGAAYTDYAERIPELLRLQVQLGYRVILITAESQEGRVLGFALAFHYHDINSTLLDFIVVDPLVRRHGIGGALYEALREYVSRLGSRGVYLEARADDPALEPNPAVRRDNRARIRFYERYGARVIAGTDYEKRREGRESGEPYLMFDSLGDERKPSREEVRAIMSALLFRKYEYPRDNEYAKGLVESVRSDPVDLQPSRGQPAEARPVQPREVFRPIKILIPEQHTLHHVRERGYVERPARVDKIATAIQGMTGVETVPVQEFGEAPITAVHDPDFVHYLQRVCSKLPEGEAVYPYVFPIRFPERKPDDEEVQAGYYCIDTFTPLTRNAYIAARAAVDCALTGAALLQRGERLVYAICRPPGHHAERRVYGGFCYFNNAAIAAHTLSAIGKVAVIDIDFHHGNGTQDVFYERSDVLTLSIHGDPAYAYPYFAGFDDEHGAGAGKGFNHNFPLPENVGDDEYLPVLERALELIRNFDPAWLVISLGLDIARGDPTGAWLISANGFERIGAAFAGLSMPALVVQEGGYDTRVLGRNARAFITGLQRTVYDRRVEAR